jgi:hypothetical protein
MADIEKANNTGKKQRRERLSTRDHMRSIQIAHAAHELLSVLMNLYPNDMELRIAAPAVQRFIGDTDRTARNEMTIEATEG